MRSGRDLDHSPFRQSSQNQPEYLSGQEQIAPPDKLKLAGSSQDAAAWSWIPGIPTQRPVNRSRTPQGNQVPNLESLDRFDGHPVRKAETVAGPDTLQGFRGQPDCALSKFHGQPERDDQCRGKQEDQTDPEAIFDARAERPKSRNRTRECQEQMGDCCRQRPPQWIRKPDTAGLVFQNVDLGGRR